MASDPTMNGGGIPVMKTPMDMMSAGPNGTNLASAAVQRHPVDKMQRASAASTTGGLDLQAVRRIYGTGLAMRLVTERQLASRAGGRLLGAHGGGMYMESRAMYESVTGEDMTINFGDVLGRPCDDPMMTTSGAGAGVGGADPHAWMEHKLKL